MQRAAGWRERFLHATLGHLHASTARLARLLKRWLDACSKWPCTAAERTALVNASLVASDALLAASARWGKVISLSSHTSLGSDSSYYNAYANILVKYPQTGEEQQPLRVWGVERCSSSKMYTGRRALHARLPRGLEHWRAADAARRARWPVGRPTVQDWYVRVTRRRARSRHSSPHRSAPHAIRSDSLLWCGGR